MRVSLGDLWETMEIYGDLWRPMEIYGDLWRSMEGIEKIGQIYKTPYLDIDTNPPPLPPLGIRQPPKIALLAF